MRSRWRRGGDADLHPASTRPPARGARRPDTLEACSAPSPRDARREPAPRDDVRGHRAWSGAAGDRARQDPRARDGAGHGSVRHSALRQRRAGHRDRASPSASRVIAWVDLACSPGSSARLWSPRWRSWRRRAATLAGLSIVQHGRRDRLRGRLRRGRPGCRPRCRSAIMARDGRGVPDRGHRGRRAARQAIVGWPGRVRRPVGVRADPARLPAARRRGRAGAGAGPPGARGGNAGGGARRAGADRPRDPRRARALARRRVGEPAGRRGAARRAARDGPELAKAIECVERAGALHQGGHGGGAPCHPRAARRRRRACRDWPPGRWPSGSSRRWPAQYRADGDTPVEFTVTGDPRPRRRGGPPDRVPDRAGGADQRAQARAGPARHRRPGATPDAGDGPASRNPLPPAAAARPRRGAGTGYGLAGLRGAGRPRPAAR